ncbi:lariat debranching enzyme, C-terminal domain-containing protein [Podospora didyma]|uniref:Lariat debranching enzyme, C-terminal domain-containing protein n=1 Tax=Podospora didyma TaxID=330526 RepID=A0AAE0NTQ6_9PEZI|nr:lariat debranching enzyme, C-terminal domain-containing protein [Podospora didyma]
MCTYLPRCESECLIVFQPADQTQGHGTLNAIYAAVERSCKERQWDGVDVLIIGGDFQAVRNAADLSVMSCPVKYRELGDFHEYYSGARKAPYLTLFVAGNHEASSHLWELYYGGWAASNIYYMGAANVLRLGPLRIMGMSGIWKGFDYRKPHHERLPFSQDDVKSFYHVREIDVRKLLQLRTQVDIGISHDWPRAVEKHGNQRHLFNMKPDFERESHDGTLGNVAAEYVMDRLRPPYWFSAHMHCKFSAIKTYEPPPKTATDSTLDEPDNLAAAKAAPKTAAPTAEAPPPTASNKDPIDALRALLPASFAKPATAPLSQQPKTTPGQPVPETITNTTVRFLALDKCLPGRKFLQLCEIPPFSPPTDTTTTAAAIQPPAEADADNNTPQRPRYKLQYDPEWLAINRVFASSITIGDRTAQIPANQGEAAYRALIEAEEAWVDEHLVRQKKLDVPENFVQTAPPHVPGAPEITSEQPDEYTNPQTVTYCALIGVPNQWAASEEERQERKVRGPPPAEFGGGGGGRGGGGGYRGGGGGGRGGWRGGRGGGGGGGRGRGRGRGGRW